MSTPSSRTQSNPNLNDSEPLTLPPLTSQPLILSALNELTQSLAAGRIKRAVAATLLSAFKLASRLLNEMAERGLSLATPSHPEPHARNPQPRNWQPDGQVAARLAATGDPAKGFGTDDLVKEMMAQINERSSRSFKLDPVFTRA